MGRPDVLQIRNNRLLVHGYRPKITASHKRLLAFEGDVGARRLLQECGSSVVKVEVKDKGVQKLIASNDYMIDQGHEFGSQLTDEDKSALIEYLKTF